MTYWLFSGSFIAAVLLHLVGSLLIAVWLLWREDALVDWHGTCMLTALAAATVGAAASVLLPPA